MGLGPGSGFAGFFPGVNQGLQDVQEYDARQLQNQRQKEYLNQQMRENNAAQQNAQWYANQQGFGQIPQVQTGDPVISKIVTKFKGLFGGRNQAPNQSTTGQSTPPASQATVPGQSNQAASPPGPSSSNAAAPGVPGASGAQTLDSETQPVTSVGLTRANGGAIPGKYGRSGALRNKKAKPQNVAKPTAAAANAMHMTMEKAPVDAQEMGAEGGPPGNTDAQPSNQDPMLANGGAIRGRKRFDNGGMINAARQDAQSGKASPAGIEQDQQISDRLSSPNHRLPVTKTPPTTPPKPLPVAPEGSYASGGIIKPIQTMEPKPNPKMAEQTVNNDGQRNRLGKTIKRFADGSPGSVAPDIGSEDEMVARAAANRAANPASVSSSTGTFVNDTTKPAVGLEGAETVAPKAGIPGRVVGGLRKAVNSSGKAGTAGAGLILGAAAAQNANTSTNAYMDRFGIEPPDDPGTPSIGGFLKTTGARLAGYASDVGNDLTGGWLQREHDKLYPNYPWNSDGPPSQNKPPQQNDDLQPIQVTAQKVPVPGGPQGPAAPRAAGPGGPQGPAKPPGPIDFSNVDVDHRDIPNTTADDWDELKKRSMFQMISNGVPPAQAKVAVEDQVSDYQHRQFMQMMQQGIALDAAGNKAGAMAALKTAYQYMPTGHDVQFGIDRASGNIVGFGIDEKTGKPVGAPVLLDQKNLNNLLATYQDPKAFMNESLAMREQALREQQVTKGQIPLERAQAGEAGARANYFNGLNQERLEVAAMRGANSAGARLPPQTQKFYAQQLNGAIMNPADQGEALSVAAQLEGKYGNTPQAQMQIAGLLKQMYSLPPEQRTNFAQRAGIQLSGQGGGQMPQMDPYAAGYNYGGYGVPPR